MDGAGPLLCAARQENVHMLHLLLCHVCESGTVSVDSSDGTGDTALILCVRAGNMEGVEHCLSAGASVHARDAMGATPLHSAARGGHVAIANALLRYGSQADSIDGDGHMPCDLATTDEIRCILEAARDELFEKWSEKSYDSAQDDRPWH